MIRHRSLIFALVLLLTLAIPGLAFGLEESGSETYAFSMRATENWSQSSGRRYPSKSAAT